MNAGDANKPRIMMMAARSARKFVRVIWRGRLHLRRGRAGRRYVIEDGRVYQVFRETFLAAATSDPVVLVVGFRLRWLGTKRLLHWLFQRVCILTTPFWSGLSGFRTKLWMVAPATCQYLGIYEWDGADRAQDYVQALVRVLRPLSVENTVWYTLHPGERLDPYLAARDAKLLLKPEGGSHAHAIA